MSLVDSYTAASTVGVTAKCVRLQRRLSDPSANIAKFARGGWRTRERDADKSRSENEGLDSLVDGITEVEAGDLRDGGYSRSRFSMSLRFCIFLGVVSFVFVLFVRVASV